jgi:hypothetical protein
MGKFILTLFVFSFHEYSYSSLRKFLPNTYKKKLISLLKLKKKNPLNETNLLTKSDKIDKLLSLLTMLTKNQILVMYIKKTLLKDIITISIIFATQKKNAFSGHQKLTFKLKPTDIYLSFLKKN